ncbi:hypothetical protein CLF_110614 [Clonorchis sinensis]|uniref:Endonuclease/exonuclease/phosphatase domain-containing protein n=1 Tax=Clonorchis sinensis TaxID=79923 RepID=G7YTQ1_CLOSI|nr:hypothetical protein CLF_110614 [Clonorchis sinensis]
MAVRRTCLYAKGAMHSQNKKKTIKNKTNSSLPNHTDQCKCSYLIDVLAAKLELFSKALTDANTKNAAIQTKVDRELSSLNEYLALPTPGQLAAKKFIQLSDAAIKTATASLVDRRVRESRPIIWGSFSRKITPTKQAQLLLGSVLLKPDHESLHADWLRQKGSKRTLGLLVTTSSPSAVQKILGRPVSVQKANPTIRHLSEDRPLDARKLGHSGNREEVRKRLPDGANSADPKLKAKPIVVIDPCAPESTPSQMAAIPGSSFYSTTANPSNSKGSAALEEASLTWTERQKYAELSALLSITDVKGATVSSTPKSQPSWTGSDERSQAAEPTGKPTTCADVDIGECCGNRTTTEAVKLPISSSTPSKVACLIVDTVVAQDLDSQSLKPDHGEPDSPPYTQLATLIAGDSDVHTSAKARKMQPNKPYTIRQIRKLLAGFSVQSSEKTSLMGAPPKELLVPLRGSDSLLLGVVYRSPSSPPEDDHFLIRTLGQLSSSYHFTHLLLVGDLNAPKASRTELQCVGSSGHFAAALTEVVQQSAWSQHVVAPTRYHAGQQPSLLDLVITNERQFVDQVTINAPLGHSDHCVLTFDFICYWARNPEPQTWIRNFCRADFSGMRIFLNQVKLGPASVEDLYRTIVQKVHEADAMFVPKKPARSRMSRKLPKRICLLEKRSQIFFKKLTTGDTEDELAFRKMRNRCKSEIRKWNIRKQATILDLARKNRNVLFKYMRHRRRNKPSAFSLRDRNGEPTSDPIVESEFYRDHYAVWNKLLSHIRTTSSHVGFRKTLSSYLAIEDVKQLASQLSLDTEIGPKPFPFWISPKLSY